MERSSSIAGTNAQIAADLVPSQKTVESRVLNLFNRQNVSSRVVERAERRAAH